MGKDLHKKTISYLEDLLEKAVDPDTISSLHETISYLDNLSDKAQIGQEGAPLYFKIAQNLDSFPEGDISQNQELALKYLYQVLSVWKKESLPNEWANAILALGIVYSERIMGDRSENQEKAIGYYRQALTVLQRNTAANKWAWAIEWLGYVYMNRIKGDKSKNQENAIKCFQKASLVIKREADPVNWAHIMENLGLIYQERVKGGGSYNQLKAIYYCEQALTVLTKNEFPVQWANIMYCLGLVHTDRVKGNPSENQEKAIDCYHQVIQVGDKVTLSINRKKLLFDLGLLYYQRIQGDHSENEEKAVDLYEELLKDWDQGDAPEDWALSMHNLGIFYRDRILGDPSENIEKAIECARNSLKVWTRDSDPLNYAIAMYTLGNIYENRINGGTSKNQEKAIVCYDNALSAWKKEDAPMDWGNVKFDKGFLYTKRIKGERSYNQEKAIKCYEEALSVLQKDRYPMKWAKIMHCLGLVHADRVKGNPSENQEKAIKHYKAALDIWETHVADPFESAKTMTELGNTYLNRLQGDRVSNQEEAIKCYKKSLSIFNKEKFPIDWGLTMITIGDAYNYFDKKDGTSENKEIAIKYYQEALQVLKKDEYPEAWALIIYSLADIYARYRTQGNPSENIERAIAYYKKTLTVWTKESAPEYWADVMDSLGSAYFSRIKGDPSENIERVIGYYTEALSIRKKNVLPMECSATMYHHGRDYWLGEPGEEAPSANNEKAIIYLNQALEIRGKQCTPRDWANVKLLLGFAYAQSRQLDYSERVEKKIECLSQALSVFKKHTDPRLWSLIMHELGDAYSKRVIEDKADENMERAREYYNQALTVRKKDVDPIGFSSTITALGSAQSDVDFAIDCYNQALSVLRKEVNPQEWAAVVIKISVAYRYRHGSKDAEKGINYCKQALQLIKKKDDPLNWARIMRTLGNHYVLLKEGDSLHNFQKSIQYYKDALEIITAENDFDSFCNIHLTLGCSIWNRGQITNNETLIKRAYINFRTGLENCCKMYSEISHPVARRNWLREYRYEIHFGLKAFLMGKRYSEALYWLERIRSQSLLEDINLENLRPSKKRATELALEYWKFCREINYLRTSLSEDKKQERMVSDLLTDDSRFKRSIASFSLQKKRSEEIQIDLKEKIAAGKQILQELRNLDQDYVNLIQAESLQENQLYELLAETRSAALQCFCDTSEGRVHFLMVYICDSEVCYKHWKLNVPPTFMDALGDYLDSYYQESDMSNIKLLESLLKETGYFMQPVADSLKKLGLKRLYLLPHSYLQAVPLHAAFLSQTASYFCEDFQVCYTPSLTLSYRLFLSKANSGRRVLALFYSPDDQPLDDGRQEFENLYNVYDQNELISLKGREATLGRLKTISKDEKEELLLIDLICHGQTTSGSASLCLANGYVSSDEFIKQLDLSGLPLIILEACETGKSEDWIADYEEYHALDNTFLQMGARSVISSFYRINDKGTLEVMNQFHRNFKEGQSPSTALQEAQKRIIGVDYYTQKASANRGRVKVKSDKFKISLAHPYYWAFLKYSGTF